MGNKVTREEFLKRANHTHNNKYDYSNTDVSNKRLIIVCPIHGEFEQSKMGHLVGRGCRKCGFLAVGAKKWLSKEHMVSEIIKIINNNDNYWFDENQIYYGLRPLMKKININCKMHGEFTRSYNEIVTRGRLCPICAKIVNHSHYSGITIDEAKNIKCFVYLLAVVCGDEKFFKIGISINLDSRLRCYKHEGLTCGVVAKNEMTLKEAIEKERYLLEKLREFKYVPKKEFAGYSECFKITMLKELCERKTTITKNER